MIEMNIIIKTCNKIVTHNKISFKWIKIIKMILKTNNKLQVQMNSKITISMSIKWQISKTYIKTLKPILIKD